jgi:hypothetical protein
MATSDMLECPRRWNSQPDGGEAGMRKMSTIVIVRPGLRAGTSGRRGR